ncbi:hypothetical protein ACLMJK_007597 [Lecanora helva]
MSRFFAEDTVAFRDDSAIIGTIERTWSETEPEPIEDLDRCYVHKSQPWEVRAKWFTEGLLSPGYVIVEFMRPYDGSCLISEDSLLLIDRAFVAGDVVKKGLSNPQSGTIISTSMLCSLQPVCSESKYNATQYIPAEGHISSHTIETWKSRATDDRDLLHGFPKSRYNRPISLHNVPTSPSVRQVSAQDVTYWNNYREEDFVIFRKSWIGQIEEVEHEVTIRLSNGSVVVVQDAYELEEPYWIPGSPSYELVKRLDRAGYCRQKYEDYGNLLADADGDFYPGQRVQTKKGNLRCGRWVFGAYDPTVAPQGIVVDVRCVKLQVRWVDSTQSLPPYTEVEIPPAFLGLDEIESGELQRYDRSKLPKIPLGEQLPDAFYSPDLCFGLHVRFRDLGAAILKYGQASVHQEVSDSTANDVNYPNNESNGFRRIPRTATQGFDMNVLRVTSTKTTVKVRWQDCSVTEESAIHLQPYLEPDEHDIWPGDKVCLQAEEVQTGNSIERLCYTHKVGVVQYVDAAARMAHVRWYLEPHVCMEVEGLYQEYNSKYGPLGNEISRLPIYDLAAHPTLVTALGDLAMIFPKGKLEDSGESSTGISWFGEVVDTCLDGDIMVRLGLEAPEAFDVKIHADRVIVIASDDAESESWYTDDEEHGSDKSEIVNSFADASSHVEPDQPIDIGIEDEGDDEMSDNVDQDDPTENEDTA